MKYEIAESEYCLDAWHVEALDDEGQCLMTVFSGPDAKQRATGYVNWKNGVETR
jgi:hypothetical protein